MSRHYIRATARVFAVLLLIAQPGLHAQGLSARVVSASQASNDIVTRAIVGPDRRIYAIDLTAGTVAVFDSTGSRVKTIRANDGRRFEGPYAIGFKADTFWVSDASRRAVSLYTQDRFSRTIRNTAQRPSAETYFEIVGLAPDGQVWLDEGGSLSAETGMTRNGRAVAIAAPGDSTVREVARLSARNLAMTLKLPNGGVFVGAQPWASTDIYALSTPSNAMAFVKRFDDYGHACDPSIVEVFDGNGRFLWQRTISLPSVSVTDALVAAAANSVLDPAIADEYGDRAAALRAVRGALYVPASLPAISRVVVSHRGQVWLEHTTPTETRVWTVLNPDGSHAGNFAIPADVRVEDVSAGWVIGVRVDNAKRTQVVRLKLQ